MKIFRHLLNMLVSWPTSVPCVVGPVTKLKPGLKATLSLPDGTQVQGTVRTVGPTVDLQTRNGLVYVDLPVEYTGHALRAGMFARGEFELDRTQAMTLPQSAVILRDGFSYVFLLKDQNKVSQTKVSVGRRLGEQIEILGGIKPGSRVVATGAGFLVNGDTVRVLNGSQQ